jgi:hypothetical protein
LLPTGVQRRRERYAEVDVLEETVLGYAVKEG